MGGRLFDYLSRSIHIFIVFLLPEMWVLCGEDKRDLFYNGTILYLYFIYVQEKKDKGIFDKFILILLLWNMIGSVETFNGLHYLGAVILTVTIMTYDKIKI